MMSKTLGVVAVDAGDAVVRGRDLGLLLDVHHPAVIAEDRDAEVAQVLRLGHRASRMRAPVGIGPEGVDHGPDGALHDVVGQHDEHRVAVDEALGQAQGLGDAAGLLLVGVGEPVDAELVPVAQQAQELAGVGAPGDQHDLVDARCDTTASIDQAIMGRS